MLGCLRRAFEMLGGAPGPVSVDIATIPAEDSRTYAMIRKADTLGTFQIESRAQMAMLPRLKPTTFYDLVVQVAIVRPGPIQGDMVHPVPAAARRVGTAGLSQGPELQAGAGQDAWACRCSRSRRCRWPSSALGSPRARPTSFGGRWRRSSSPGASRTSRTSWSRGWSATATSGSSRSGPSRSWRVRLLRLPREPRGVVRAGGVRVGLGEVPPPRRVLRGAAERAADGVLRPGPDRAGRAGASGAGAARLRQRQRAGIARWSAAATAARAGPSGWGCAW